MLPESLNDAYIEAVKALGGSKAVGVALWPAKGVEAAQRQLLACLNNDRAEKLGPDECLHIERMARDAGCHVVAEYRVAALHYSRPEPVEPEDERAKLQREFVQSVQAMQALAKRLESVGVPVLRAA